MDNDDDGDDDDFLYPPPPPPPPRPPQISMLGLRGQTLRASPPRRRTTGRRYFNIDVFGAGVWEGGLWRLVDAVRILSEAPRKNRPIAQVCSNT